MSIRRTVLPVALALLLVLAGCSGGGSGGAERTQAAQTEADGAPSVDSGGGGSGGGDAASGEAAKTGASDGSLAASAQVQARYRIKTAEARVEVSDFDEAHATLVSEARSLGGYLDESSQERHRRNNVTWETGTVTLRVPAENYSALLDAVRSVGTVESLTTDTRDVTGKVVDLKARLKNLKAQRERLRRMYERANETESMLKIQRRLSEVQSQIEQLQGRLRVLQHRVAYSTVTVKLQEERPEDLHQLRDRTQWYDVGLVAAFLESVHGVVVVGRALGVVAAYAAPYVLVLTVPTGGAFVAYRRFRGRE